MNSLKRQIDLLVNQSKWLWSNWFEKRLSKIFGELEHDFCTGEFLLISLLSIQIILYGMLRNLEHIIYELRRHHLNSSERKDADLYGTSRMLL